jgi:membrane dipeptidase
MAARKNGKIAALIGIEGGHAIEDSLDKLREFYKLGARYMTLTHSNTNNWADSSGDAKRVSVKHHGGLSDFGREVVLEMNRLGMLVDISHVADDTFWDVMATSKAPVIASHSSCRAISPAPRNMSDDMIRALAKKHGVIHINFACSFLNAKIQAEGNLRRPLQTKYGDDMDAAREATERMFSRATLDDVVEHVAHVVKIAGIDAVGLGSDFDGVDCTPVGLEDVGKFPNLTRALLEKRFTPEQIRKIYGENTVRVMREVEAAAHRR